MHRYSKRAKERKKKQKKKRSSNGWCALFFFLFSLKPFLCCCCCWFVGSLIQIHPFIYPSMSTHSSTFYLFHSENRFVVFVSHTVSNHFTAANGRPIYTVEHVPSALCPHSHSSVYFTFGYLSSYTFRTHHHTTRIYVCVLRMAKTHKFLSIFYHSI